MAKTQKKTQNKQEPKQYAAIMRMLFVWVPANSTGATPTDKDIWGVKIVPFAGFPSQEALTSAVHYYCLKYGISKADAVDQHATIPEEDKQLMQNITDYQQAWHDDNFVLVGNEVNTQFEKI